MPAYPTARTHLIPVTPGDTITVTIGADSEVAREGVGYNGPWFLGDHLLGEIPERLQYRGDQNALLIHRTPFAVYRSGRRIHDVCVEPACRFPLSVTESHYVGVSGETPGGGTAGPWCPLCFGRRQPQEPPLDPIGAPPPEPPRKTSWDYVLGDDE